MSRAILETSCFHFSCRFDYREIQDREGETPVRYLTAGETHGPQLTAIIEGMPSNLAFDFEAVNEQLARRQKGYGRGRRMQIEKDTVEVVGGVRHGRTTDRKS